MSAPDLSLKPPVLLHASENAERDEHGYIKDKSLDCDTSTWQGRAWKRFDDGGRDSRQVQRDLGYQVYEGDPGKDPRETSYDERRRINGAAYNQWCWPL